MSDQNTEPKPLFEVGERQYDVDAAKNKIINADNHIQTLEEERKADLAAIEELKQKLAESEGKLETATKLDQVMEKMSMNQQSQQATDTTNTGVDLEALKKQILEEAGQVALTQTQQFEQSKIEQANQLDAISAAKAVFGSEYDGKLREVGKTLGLNDEAIQAMAKGNPALFKQTFNLNRSAQSFHPNNGLNTASFEQHKAPELRKLSKEWGVTNRVAAVQQNEEAMTKLVAEHGAEKAAQILGLKTKFN